MDTVTITIFVLNGNVLCIRAMFLVFSYIFNLFH